MSQRNNNGDLLDLLIIFDVTASMGSYIESAKDNILEICNVLLASGRLQQERGLQVALVAYRDYPEIDNEFVIKPHPFTDDLNDVEEYLMPLTPHGGNDYPEAFSTAFEYAVERMEGWRDKALKAIIVVTDAAPHGIGELGDSYPRGSPTGMQTRDPIALAREKKLTEGYSVFVLGCEPTLSKTTKYAIDFYKALADMTLGAFCCLTDHRLLAALIIGSLLEELDLRKLSSQYQSYIAKRVLEDGLSIENIIDELCEKINAAGQRPTSVERGDIYKHNPDAEHNYKTFMESNSLGDAKRSLRRVRGRRQDLDCMAKVQEYTNTFPRGGADFSTVIIRFKNNGRHRIVLQMFDGEARSMCNDIVVPDNFVITKEFKINIPVNFVLVCGPRTKNFSRTFDNEQDIDVDSIFNNS